MLCERALTRYTHGSILAEKQMIQDWIAESYAEMQAARLLTLQAAWKMDQLHAAGKHYSDARVEIGVIKFWGAKVLYNVIDRAIQIHGSLGYTTDLPLESMYRHARAARIYDGPDEVHKVTVARQVLKRYRASDPPTEHVPTRRAAAIEKFADAPRRRHAEHLNPSECRRASECWPTGRPSQTLRWHRTLGWTVTGSRRCRSTSATASGDGGRVDGASSAPVKPSAQLGLLGQGVQREPVRVRCPTAGTVRPSRSRRSSLCPRARR